MGPGDREIDALESELRDTDDPALRRELEIAISEVGSEMEEEQAWRDEGHDRGWG